MTNNYYPDEDSQDKPLNKMECCLVVTILLGTSIGAVVTVVALIGGLL